MASSAGFDPAVSIYSIDVTTGKLTSIRTVDAGGFVLSVAVHPSDKFAYATVMERGFLNSHVSMYTLDANTGNLASIGTVPAERSSLSITIDPGGKFGYVANSSSHSISAHRIDPDTGILTLVGTIGT